MVSDAFSTVKKLTKDYEVIVVNDGSIDKSADVLTKLKAKYNNLKIITHKKNRGYGGALKSGFKAATKDLVSYCDGDGQYDIKELPILVSLMTDDVNFVNGIKMRRGDPTYRIFIGNLYSFIARWLFWLPVYDVDGDFRLIRRNIIKKIVLNSDSGSICVELVKKSQRAGAKFRQVSVHHYERRFGNSQFFRADKLISTLRELSMLWVNLILLKR